MSSELAIFGGPKAVKMAPPHFTWPEITASTEDAVLDQLRRSVSIYDRSGIIGELENRLALYFGRRHALLTSSGTAALHSLFVGAQLGQDAEVIAPAYTFFASLTPLFFTGAVPVLADCGEDGNIDPDEVERLITPRSKAILAVHLWGIPCRMDRLQAIADKHGIVLLEDASHAHGAKFRGESIGSGCHASAFSMQAQKGVPAGEGGFLLTDDDEVFYRALLLGHYNKRCLKEIPKGHPLRRFAVTGFGLKYRIHPLAASIALQQLNRLDQIIDRRREVARYMNSRFGQMPFLRTPSVPEDAEPSWYAFVLHYLPEPLNGLPIERFHEAALAEGCTELDRPASICPLTQHPLFQNPGDVFPPYQGKLSYGPASFPRAEAFHSNALKLPVPHTDDAERLIDEYANAFEKTMRSHKALL